MELLTAVAIVGITAAFAVPQYQKTMERSYYRAAQDILQAIWTGERVYYSKQNPATATYLPLAAGGSWGTIFMDNPNTSNPLPVAFTVDAPGPSFTATATRSGSGSCGGKQLWITQTRSTGGDWSSSGVCPP